MLLPSPPSYAESEVEHVKAIYSHVLPEYRDRPKWRQEILSAADNATTAFNQAIEMAQMMQKRPVPGLEDKQGALGAKRVTLTRVGALPRLE